MTLKKSKSSTKKSGLERIWQMPTSGVVSNAEKEAKMAMICQVETVPVGFNPNDDCKTPSGVCSHPRVCRLHGYCLDQPRPGYGVEATLPIPKPDGVDERGKVQVTYWYMPECRRPGGCNTPTACKRAGSCPYRSLVCQIASALG
jgi:hypothetical protein